MYWNDEIEILAEVAAAMLLGGLIGIERQIADKPAGFRTHMLVAGSAALLVGLAPLLVGRFEAGDGIILRADPVGVVGAIITGVSFLGAGTIFRRSTSHDVQGLTTAASLLVSSAIGIAIALQQFVLGSGVTVMALIVLRGLSVVDRWLQRVKAD